MTIFARREQAQPQEEGVFRDDLKLMELVCNGDVRAQRLLAMRVSSRGMRIARSFVGQESEAEDVMQDCLLEVFRSARLYRGDAPLEAWATKIVVRRSMRHVKRVRLKRLERETLMDAGTMAMHAASEPQHDAPLGDQVDRIVRSLPIDVQLVLRLRFDMGFTVEEIAVHTGAPHSTVKKRLLRAIAKVREVLRESQQIGSTKGERP